MYVSAPISSRFEGLTLKIHFTQNEYEVNETMPWPGKEIFDGEAYVKLSKESNVDSKTGIAKKYPLTEIPASLDTVSFSDYEVVKHE
jgi:hypothetical protein